MDETESLKAKLLAVCRENADLKLRLQNLLLLYRHEFEVTKRTAVPAPHELVETSFIAFTSTGSTPERVAESRFRR